MQHVNYFTMCRLYCGVLRVPSQERRPSTHFFMWLSAQLPSAISFRFSFYVSSKLRCIETG
jgi:hypothetical protein